MTTPRNRISLPLEWVIDPNLSHRDLGVLVRLLSFDPKHSVKLEELADMSGTGLDQNRAAIQRLIDLNYISRQVKYNAGRRRGTLYAIKPQ